MSRRLELVPPGPVVGLPTVDDVDALPVEQLVAFITELAALQARAAVRLRRESPTGRDEEQLLTIDQAAERLAVTCDWLRRRPDLPFVVRLSEGTVRYSSRRLAIYVARQAGH
jgi:hypothetical protein